LNGILGDSRHSPSGANRITFNEGRDNLSSLGVR
jgi:hypothetical protein